MTGNPGVVRKSLSSQKDDALHGSVVCWKCSDFHLPYEYFLLSLIHLFRTSCFCKFVYRYRVKSQCIAWCTRVKCCSWIPLYQMLLSIMVHTSIVFHCKLFMNLQWHTLINIQTLIGVILLFELPLQLFLIWIISCKYSTPFVGCVVMWSNWRHD